MVINKFLEKVVNQTSGQMSHRAKSELHFPLHKSVNVGKGAFTL